MAKDHSDSEREDTHMHYPTDRITPVVEHWLEREIAQWVHHEGSIRRPIAPWANALTTELHLAPVQKENVLIIYMLGMWFYTVVIIF